jgi:cupin fold WbuC family metalloprotein
MFVLYGEDTFIRPNRHLNRDESIFLLDGICDIVFFTDDGHIENVVRLESSSIEYPNFILLPANQFHSVIIRSPEALLFEATTGPFEPSITTYADWSPIETDLIGKQLFLEKIEEFIKTNGRNLGHSESRGLLTRESEKVFKLSQSFPLGFKEIQTLIETMTSENLDRVRICIHKNDDAELQEMFMVFSKNTFVTPSLHQDKDESLFVISGLATYVFFDESGNVVTRIPLGPRDNQFGRASYCRIAKGVIHALVVESDFVVVKETTSGPFVKANTIFPEWAPNSPTRKEINDLNHRYLGND